jgi:hypothetical protein
MCLVQVNSSYMLATSPETVSTILPIPIGLTFFYEQKQGCTFQIAPKGQISCDEVP